MNKIKVRNPANFEFEKTSHLSGVKKVMFSVSDVVSDVTQIALGMLNAGECVEEHVHPTMEEFFYIQSGIIELISEFGVSVLRSGDIVIIPPGVSHSLNSRESSEFLYWGVKVD